MGEGWAGMDNREKNPVTIQCHGTEIYTVAQERLLKQSGKQ